MHVTAKAVFRLLKNNATKVHRPPKTISFNVNGIGEVDLWGQKTVARLKNRCTFVLRDTPAQPSREVPTMMSETTSCRNTVGGVTSRPWSL
jgi:hypothetical protein